MDCGIIRNIRNKNEVLVTGCLLDSWEAIYIAFYIEIDDREI